MTNHGPDLDLIIPLFNEAENLPSLVEEIQLSTLLTQGLRKVLFVENGSTDKTRKLLQELEPHLEWMEVAYLNENRNYGGGVLHGLLRSKAEYLAYIPGDQQISICAVLEIWNKFRTHSKKTNQREVLFKGYRNQRTDSWVMRGISWFYTVLTNSLLGLRTLDTNGLPKLFHRRLLHRICDSPVSGFTFDAQVLQATRSLGWPIVECEVSFHRRTRGVSSWAKNRRLIYWKTLKDVWKLRFWGFSNPQTA